MIKFVNIFLFQAERGHAAIANLGVVREDEEEDSSEDEDEEFCRFRFFQYFAGFAF